MRIFFYELRKIWNPRTLAFIALLMVLAWFVLLHGFSESEQRLQVYGVYGAYATEMYDTYGETLGPGELEQFDISGKLTEIAAKGDAMINDEPVFKKYGISSFSEWMKRYNSGNIVIQDKTSMIDTKKEVHDYGFAVVPSLLMDSDTDDDVWQSPMLAWVFLHQLENRFINYKSLLTPFTHDERPIVTDAARRFMESGNNNLISYTLCSNFSGYAAITAIIALVITIVLVAPPLTNDFARRVHLLQYTSCAGRRVFAKKLTATLLTASAISLITVTLSYAAFIIPSAANYLGAHIGGLPAIGLWLYNITFGQYVIILAAITVAVCLGAAGLAFVLARYSSNVVTLMLKTVPTGAALVLIAYLSINALFNAENFVFTRIFKGRVVAPKVIVCGAVFALGVIAATVIAKREKRVDVV